MAEVLSRRRLITTMTIELIIKLCAKLQINEVIYYKSWNINAYLWRYNVQCSNNTKELNCRTQEQGMQPGLGYSSESLSSGAALSLIFYCNVAMYMLPCCDVSCIVPKRKLKYFGPVGGGWLTHLTTTNQRRSSLPMTYGNSKLSYDLTITKFIKNNL